MRRREIPTPGNWPIVRVRPTLRAFDRFFEGYAKRKLRDDLVDGFLERAADIADAYLAERVQYIRHVQTPEQQRAAITIALALVGEAILAREKRNLQKLLCIRMTLRIMCGRADPFLSLLNDDCARVFSETGLQPGELMGLDVQIYTALKDRSGLWELFDNPIGASVRDLKAIHLRISARLKAMQASNVRLLAWPRRDAVHAPTVRRVAMLLIEYDLPLTWWADPRNGTACPLVTALDAILRSAGLTTDAMGTARHWIAHPDSQAILEKLRSPSKVDSSAQRGPDLPNVSNLPTRS